MPGSAWSRALKPAKTKAVRRSKQHRRKHAAQGRAYAMEKRMHYQTVSNHKSQGKETALSQISRVLDSHQNQLGSRDKVFVKLDEWWRDPNACSYGITCCHLVVAKRRGPSAAMAYLNQTGWFSVGTVGDSTSAKAELLKRRWSEFASDCTYVFGDDALFRGYANRWRPTWFDLSAPVQLWTTVDHFLPDILKQAETDWATLVAADGHVTDAHLLLVPIDHRPKVWRLPVLRRVGH